MTRHRYPIVTAMWLATAAVVPLWGQQPDASQAGSAQGGDTQGGTRIRYREGAGLSIEDGETRVQLRFYVQPMIRFTKTRCEAPSA